MQHTKEVLGTYEKLDYREQEDKVFIDYHGYGILNAKAQNEAMSIEDLIRIIKTSDIERSIVDKQIKVTRLQKLKNGDQNGEVSFFRVAQSLLKELDPSANGYVTNQEMEDTLKLAYPLQLQNYNLKQCFTRFASIQNKLLIDYKKLLKFIQNKVQGNENEEIITSEDIRRNRMRPSHQMYSALVWNRTAKQSV